LQGELDGMPFRPRRAIVDQAGLNLRLKIFPQNPGQTIMIYLFERLPGLAAGGGVGIDIAQHQGGILIPPRLRAERRQALPQGAGG
jgi:hypothetical protein